MLFSWLAWGWHLRFEFGFGNGLFILVFCVLLGCCVW